VEKISVVIPVSAGSRAYGLVNELLNKIPSGCPVHIIDIGGDRSPDFARGRCFVHQGAGSVAEELNRVIRENVADGFVVVLFPSDHNVSSNFFKIMDGKKRRDEVVVQGNRLCFHRSLLDRMEFDTEMDPAFVFYHFAMVAEKRGITVTGGFTRVNRAKYAFLLRRRDRVATKEPATQEPRPDTNDDVDVSIIVPFMYNGDRWDIFEACISNLHELTKDLDNVEICVHETAPERYITDEFIQRYGIKYLYSQWNEVFHRAWNLNVAAKMLTRGSVLLFMDGDLIVTEDWIKEVLASNHPAIAWGELKDLDEESTKNFLKTGFLGSSFTKIRKPSIDGAAGGATLIPKNIFFDVHGWPEDFRGTWGGEDNIFISKLISFGYQPDIFSSCIFHLYHKHQTERKQSIRNKSQVLLKYSKEDWKKKFISNPEWGTIDSPIHLLTSVWEGFKEPVISHILNEKEPLVTVTTISLMRYDLLLKSLEHNPQSTSLPLNICLRIQASELMKMEDKIKILEILEKNYSNHDVQFTYKNHGAGAPRYDVTRRAIEHFGTKYVAMIDDDIMMPKYGFEAMIAFLEDNAEYGVVSFNCHPSTRVWSIVGNKMKTSIPMEPFEDTIAFGFASIMARAEIFESCNIDRGYFLGWTDTDFCMQINQAGWKMGLINLPIFHIKNCRNTQYPEYNRIRRNMNFIKESEKRFMEKWNLKIEYR
jgi:hypothetical protein